MKIKQLYFLLPILVLSACGPSDQPESGTTVSEVPETVDLKTYEGLGTQITAASFLTLSGKVKSAMQEGGVTNAVEYCKVSAYPIIDSLSQAHNASISRTSLKPRNYKNSPVPREKSVLKQFEVDWQLGKEVMPFAEDMGAAGINFYAPIWTQKACLQCHGVIGETLTAKNDGIIKGLYPNDKATGYKENDLRGMWVVNFKKDQQ
ncbi:MAG: DUF3365 domain-containing protein [Bacteroidetes bacterium]|nr:MAG: DUF3365 domain-containing protein [Bacteroidota bacterium]